MNKIKPLTPKTPLSFNIDIEVCQDNAPGPHLKFHASQSPEPKPHLPHFEPDGPHRIRLLVPSITPQGFGPPITQGLDHKSALILLAQLALSLAITSPTPQNQESFNNPS